MGTYSLCGDQLVAVQVRGVRSLPGMILGFAATRSLQKSTSKLFLALRTIATVPARKYIVNLSPTNRHPGGVNLELAIILALYQSLSSSPTFSDWLVIGEVDLNGKLIPLGKAALAQALRLVLRAGNIKRLLVPYGTNWPYHLSSLAVYTATSVAQAVHIITHDRGPAIIPTAKAPSVIALTTDQQHFVARHRMALVISLAARWPLLITAPPLVDTHWLESYLPQLWPRLSSRRQLRVDRYQLPAENGFPVWKATYSSRQLNHYWPWLRYGMVRINQPQQGSTSWWQELAQRWSAAQMHTRPHLLITALPCLCGYAGSKEQCWCSAAQRRAYHRWWKKTLTPWNSLRINLTTEPIGHPEPFNHNEIVTEVSRLCLNQKQFAPVSPPPRWHPQLREITTNWQTANSIYYLAQWIQQYHQDQELLPEHCWQAAEMIGINA